MKYLAQGQVSREYITILLEATKITSANKIAALMAHYVDNKPPVLAYGTAGVCQQGFYKSVRQLNKAASIVERALELRQSA